MTTEKPKHKSQCKIEMVYLEKLQVCLTEYLVTKGTYQESKINSIHGSMTLIQSKLKANKKESKLIFGKDEKAFPIC